MLRKIGNSFSAITKNAQMELTVRTPYKVICNKLVDFTRIITRTNEAVLVISNKMPAALHILPPGNLIIRTNNAI